MPAQQRRIWLILHALQFFVLSNIFCHASELEKLMCEVYTIFYDIWCSTIRKGRKYFIKRRSKFEVFWELKEYQLLSEVGDLFQVFGSIFQNWVNTTFPLLKSLRIMCIKLFFQVSDLFYLLLLYVQHFHRPKKVIRVWFSQN